jgi:branched-subunit amino acid transport protein
MNIWLIMLIGGVITFLMRFSLIYLLGKFEIPDSIQRSLRFVPPAVLSAIIFPEIFIRSGKPDLSFGNTRLLAGLAAVIVARLTRNTLLTILAGMGTLLILQVVEERF